MNRSFIALPPTPFRFDIGHARQIDPTMIEAAVLLKAFGPRLKEVPMSEVASNSKHEAMSLTAVSAFRKVAPWIPRDVPIILESVISPDKIEQEIKRAEFVLGWVGVVG